MQNSWADVRLKKNISWSLSTYLHHWDYINLSLFYFNFSDFSPLIEARQDLSAKDLTAPCVLKSPEKSLALRVIAICRGVCLDCNSHWWVLWNSPHFVLAKRKKLTSSTVICTIPLEEQNRADRCVWNLPGRKAFRVEKRVLHEIWLLVLKMTSLSSPLSLVHPWA